jgi:hypothetical protein
MAFIIVAILWTVSLTADVAVLRVFRVHRRLHRPLFLLFLIPMLSADSVTILISPGDPRLIQHAPGVFLPFVWLLCVTGLGWVAGGKFASIKGS